MDKLVLCGKFRSDSPIGDDSCNSQSALDFITCSNNKVENENEIATKKNKNNLSKVCKNSNHYVDLDVRASQDCSRSLDKGKCQLYSPLSRCQKSPDADKTKSKGEVKCWTGLFDDVVDDDFNRDKENKYVEHASCVNRRKRKDDVEHPQKRELQFLPGKSLEEEERICYVSNLAERFSIVRKIGSGTFGSVFLAIRLQDQRKVALKKLPKDKTKIEDFCLEFRYGRQFSKHQCILETSPIAYITKSWYILVQEYAPMSDLLRSVPPRVGLPEVAVKSVVRQVAGAVEFIHSRQVVHRDLKLENILVFQEQGDRMLTRIKLGDFGVARKVGTMVCKVCDGTTYTPPEICSLARHAYYKVERSADVWSLGVVIFCLMTGSFPWQLADISTDPLFQSFARWQCRRTPIVPEHWTRFTPALRNLFQQYLEVRSIKRADVSILSEFLETPWSSSTSNSLNGSTDASIVISTCNASGSASTLTCQMSNHRLSNSSADSSATTCSHFRHSHLISHHGHSLGQRNEEQCSDRASCNSESLCRVAGHQTNRVTPTLDDVYRNNPLMTSGALHSPPAEDDIYKGHHSVLCGKQRESLDRSSRQDAEMQRQVRRCHHHHHHLHHHNDKDTTKTHCKQPKKAKPCTVEKDPKEKGSEDAKEFDAETLFRLERVNRWIMNQTT